MSFPYSPTVFQLCVRLCLSASFTGCVLRVCPSAPLCSVLQAYFSILVHFLLCAPLCVSQGKCVHAMRAHVEHINRQVWPISRASVTRLVRAVLGHLQKCIRRTGRSVLRWASSLSLSVLASLSFSFLSRIAFRPLFISLFAFLKLS